MKPRVLVSIVTYNSGVHLKACLESLKAQTFDNAGIAVWDNSSADETGQIIAEHRDLFSYAGASDRNLGFSAAHNRLIRSGASDYVLVLNPDVVLEPDYIEKLVGGLERDSDGGSATGKLLRKVDASGPARRPANRQVIDSTGIYITPSQRHFDRGSNQIDDGQYGKPEYVFGASGAAALYRRSMLEEIRYDGEYFDENFFAYREDVDLATRSFAEENNI